MTQKRAMRMKDKEITDEREIREILENCHICRLGFSEENIPYTIPINYGYTYENGIISTFFHCSWEGRKIDIIKKNPVVCFEIDYVIHVEPEEHNGIAVIWESLIGTGHIETINDVREKYLMLGNMMRKFRKYNKHYKPTPLTRERVDGVQMLKLVLDEFKAKRLLHS